MRTACRVYLMKPVPTPDFHKGLYILFLNANQSMKAGTSDAKARSVQAFPASAELVLGGIGHTSGDLQTYAFDVFRIYSAYALFVIVRRPGPLRIKSPRIESSSHQVILPSVRQVQLNFYLLILSTKRQSGHPARRY